MQPFRDYRDIARVKLGPPVEIVRTNPKPGERYFAPSGKIEVMK